MAVSIVCAVSARACFRQGQSLRVSSLCGLPQFSAPDGEACPRRASCRAYRQAQCRRRPFFDTTRDTLAKCACFGPFLEGRIGHAVNENGRLFIDRSGKLFAHLLEFMRAGARPPQQVVVQFKDALLEECKYFGLDAMAHALRGQISPFDMRYEDRCIVEEERREGDHQLFDVFKTDLAPPPRADLKLPMLLGKMDSPVVLGAYDDVVGRLDNFSGGIINVLKSIPNVVLAGGSVIGALCGVDAGGLDIFIIAPQEQGELALRAVFKAIQESQAERKGQSSKLLVTRSSAAVTMCRCYGGRSVACPVQVVTSVHQTVGELLVSFDVGCCCFAWRPREDRVWPRRGDFVLCVTASASPMPDLMGQRTVVVSRNMQSADGQ